MVVLLGVLVGFVGCGWRVGLVGLVGLVIDGYL